MKEQTSSLCLAGTICVPHQQDQTEPTTLTLPELLTVMDSTV